MRASSAESGAIPAARFAGWAALAFLFACLSARAAWRPADLPYGSFIGGPVAAVTPAGTSGAWAVAPYWYGDADQDNIRWNTLAYRSLNNGRLWDMPWDAPGNDPIANSHPFQDVQLFAASFIDANTGWLAGWRRSAAHGSDPPGDFSFYHTTDAGRTWTESTLPDTTPYAADDMGFSLDATDATHAIAIHGHRIFETSDGTTWTERAGNWPLMYAVQARGLPAPRVAGEDGGRAVSGILTPNGLLEDATVDGGFTAVSFPDVQHGYLTGGDPVGAFVLRTTDGGQTWEKVLSLPSIRFHAVSAPDTTHLWVAGARLDGSGVIYASEDGGDTWTLQFTTPGTISTLAFSDNLHGFASGDDGVFLYTPYTPAPADMDGDGQVDREDAAAVMRRAAGLLATSSTDADAAGGPPVTIVSAVQTLLRAGQGSPGNPAARALVVYNTISADTDGDGVGDSEEVARYYAGRRGIGEDHLVPITWNGAEQFWNNATPSTPRANWSACFHALVEPLRNRLDALGRDTVDTIVLTYGVPYSFTVISPDGTTELLTVDQSINDLFGVDEANWSSAPVYAAPFTSISDRYGKARFGAGGRPLALPFVDGSGTVTRGPYYLTGRVDGPSLDVCKAMVDNALFAEAYHGPGGYQGTAYVDTRAAVFNLPTGQPYDLDDLRGYLPAYGDYAGYDKSIARTILTFADRGLPWRDEITNDSIGAVGAQWRDGSPAASAPGAMFYAGWYNYGQYNDVWDWLPGSVGIDFDSASAYGFRSGTYFAGGALNAGLSAVVGVLSEPYNYHPKPDALMEYLARGFTLAEAAQVATDTPRTARAIVIGDPLYRPFAPHPPRSVPDPTLTTSVVQGINRWIITVDSDIPVRATLRYTTDGSEPGPSSQTAQGSPLFYARRHTFTLAGAGTPRYLIEAISP